MPNEWESKWKTVNPLGAGGQGTTYLVISNITGETGVLKALKNNRNSIARARMKREMASLVLLSQKGASVPSVLDHNLDADDDGKKVLYLVMDFIAGTTLREYRTNTGACDIGLATKIALQICAILHIAHSEGILHRDIKPENVIILPDNKIFMVAYGLSFNVEDDDLTETYETFRNKFLDLPETNLPGGDRRDQRSDITAVCGIYYYLLTGHNPGQLQDSSGKLPHMRSGYRVRDIIVEDPRMIQIELLLSKGFSIQTASRFQSIDELVSRLKSLTAQSESRVPNVAEMDARLTEQFHTHDRKTQLSKMLPNAEAFMKKIKDLGSRFANLKSFTISVGNGPTMNYPDGGEMLGRKVLFTLTSKIHAKTRSRVYAVIANSDQFIVHSSNIDLTDKNGRNSPKYSVVWNELTWFQDNGDDAFKNVIKDLEIWLEDNMQSIAAEILHFE